MIVYQLYLLQVLSIRQKLPSRNDAIKKEERSLDRSSSKASIRVT